MFGGNVSQPDSENDEYTNDFFEIEVKNDTAVSRRIWSDLGPPKRLSHSMSQINNQFLIVYGGEGDLKALSDIWFFNIDKAIWTEIKPSNKIPGRMVHAAATYKNCLYIFGGMGDEKIAKNELLLLSFGKKKIDQIIPEPKKVVISSHMCISCGHAQNTCSFLTQHPEIGYPKMNFFCKSNISAPILTSLIKEYPDPLSALLKVIEIISKTNVYITSHD